MKTNIIAPLKLTILLFFTFVVIYPLGIWAISQFTTNHAEGHIISYKRPDGSSALAYKHIGQQFNSDVYFWGRPSAVDYNAAGSCGSNKGPSNPDYLALVQTRIDTFLRYHSYLEKKEIPAEMVTASSSGLDPHISPGSAFIQVKRIALNRKLEEQKLKDLIVQCTEKPSLGLFGPSVVNVLQLNIALDQLN